MPYPRPIPRYPPRSQRSSAVIFLFLAVASASPDGEISRLAKIMGWKSGDVIADIGSGEGDLRHQPHSPMLGQREESLPRNLTKRN